MDQNALWTPSKKYSINCWKPSGNLVNWSKFLEYTAVKKINTTMLSWSSILFWWPRNLVSEFSFKVVKNLKNEGHLIAWCEPHKIQELHPLSKCDCYCYCHCVLVVQFWEKWYSDHFWKPKGIQNMGQKFRGIWVFFLEECDDSVKKRKKHKSSM